MAEFKIGDAVRRRTGNNKKMVVLEVGDFGPDGPKDGVKCQGLAKGRQKKKAEFFSASELEPYVEPSVGELYIRSR